MPVFVFCFPQIPQIYAEPGIYRYSFFVSHRFGRFTQIPVYAGIRFCFPQIPQIPADPVYAGMYFFFHRCPWTCIEKYFRGTLREPFFCFGYVSRAGSLVRLTV